MKWNHPKDGDIRIMFQFLLFPKRIGYETKWLCVGCWREFFDVEVQEGWLRVKWLSTNWIGNSKPMPWPRVAVDFDE